MAKRKMAYALSAIALTLGSGVFAPTTFAVGECSAGDLGTLQECLGTSTTDIIITNTIAVASDANFDFSGLTIETTGGGYSMFDVSDGAELTINGDGSIVKRGTAGNIFVVEGNDSLLTLNGGTFSTDAPGRDVYGVYLMSGGEVVVNEGATIDTTGSNGAAIGGNNTTGYMYATINGGTLRSKYQTVYMPQQVSLDIEDGSTLDGGIVARMGHINVHGGTIVGKDGGDTIENYYNLSNGYPWVADAIMVMGGTYVNNNDDQSNALEINISGGEISSDDGYALALYDMGKVTQEMSINISGGKFAGNKGDIRRATVAELVSNPAVGYGEINNAINVSIIGGNFSVEPDGSEIVDDMEPDQEEDGTWAIYPKRIDYNNDWLESDSGIEGQISATVEFGSELIADRKATLSVTEKSTDSLALDEDKGGELIGAFEIDMLDRSGATIPVENNALAVYIDLDEETHAMLSAYDELYAVYFEDGAEVERFKVTLSDPADGYWLSFETPHLSTYGIVGVNNGTAAETTEAGTPETGTVTREGASAMSAALITAIAVGLLVSIVSFAVFIRRK